MMCICVMMLVNLMPMQMMEVKAADLDALKTVRINGEDYTTDGHEVMAYRLQPGTVATYDVFGKYKGVWIRTTYQYNDRSLRGYVPKATSSAVSIKATPKFINEGRYIQMTYTLTSSSKVTSSFSIAADIMIDNDDNAPITAFSDGSGFKMVNRSTQAQFNFYGKNVYGANPGISTYWFGYYSNRDSYRYTQTTAMNLSGTDSAMGCSWKNLSIDNKGVDVSMIIGTGEANTAPEVGEIIVPDDSAFVPGKDVTITVPIENATGDNAKDKLKLYYSLLKPDGTIINGPNLISDVTTNVSGAITNFVATFQIPNYMPSGPFVLRVFAMNAKGGISAEVSKSLTATGQPINITSTTGDVTTSIATAKTLSVTLTSSSTAENPLLYQWQKQVNGVYVDIVSATQANFSVPVNEVGVNTYRAKIRYKNDTTSTVYSTAMKVTVDKAKSNTTITSNFNQTTGTLRVEATVTPQGGQSVNGNEVKFYNGNTLLGSSTIANGKAALVIAKDNLMSGPYTLQAIYAGNATLYSSSSSSQSLNVNLTMQILYDQFIQANDSGVIRSYKEGIETVLKDPAIAREGYAFLGWMSATGEVIDRLSATLRGDIRLTSQWKKTTFEVTLDDNLGSPSKTSSYISNRQVSITAPEKEHYTFAKWVCNDASLIRGKETNSNLQFKMPEKDVSLVAQYRNAEYAITYTGIEAQANWPSNYTYGSKKLLPTPSKENALFLGWHKNTADGEIITELTSSDSGSITLYPAWSQLYQVTIKNNIQGDAQTPIVAKFPQGEQIIIPSSTIAGYTFEKWQIVSGTVQLDNSENETLDFIMTNENVEIEAQYKALSYAIQYNLDGGINHADNPNEYSFNSRIDLKQPTKEGYRFDGWFSDANLTVAKTAISETDSGALSLYAKWTKNNFIVTLNDASMSDGATSKTINYGEIVTFKANAKIGYSFTEWQKSDANLVITDNGNETYQFTMPNHPVSIKAEYEKTRFAITYHNVEGIDISNVDQYPNNYVLGYEWTLKNPTKEGYDFTGWFSDEAMMSPFSKIGSTQTGMLDLYGKWSINAYKLDVDGGTIDGTSTSIEQVNYQTSLSLKANLMPGMRFTGWFDQDNQNVSTNADFTYSMPGKNTVLQARFEPESYTITYDMNAGDYVDAQVSNPDAAKQNYTYGENYTFAYPTLKNASSETLMTFDGWKIKGTDKKITTITPMTLGNLELLATWVPEVYTITYENIEGSHNSNDLNMSNEKYNTSSAAQTISLSSPTKSGYDFTGWTTSAETITISDKTQMTLPHGHTGDIVLRATWVKKAIPYSVDGVSKTAQIDDIVEVKRDTLGDGQEFVNWQVSGNALLANSTKATTSFVMDATLIESIEAGTSLLLTSHTRNATYKLQYEGIENAVNNNPTSYVYGTGATLSAPSKTGYTFNGWTADQTISDNVISPQHFSDITLTATWTAIDYEVVIVNGSLNLNTRETLQSAHYGDTIQITADEKPGYAFAGWSLVKGDVTFADTQSPTTSFTMCAGEVEIMATYALNAYNVSYMDGVNNITTENPSHFTIDDEVITLVDANKDGYDFKGWYDNEGLSGDAITTIPIGSIGDKVFYAKFEKLHNTITFEQSGLGSYEVKVNGTPQTISNKRYSTQERGLNVRVNFTPAKGYTISKILVNGVEYDTSSDLRFDDFFGNYTIKVIFSGAPTIDTPTSGNHDLTWSEGEGKENIVDTYTKDDVEILAPSADDTKVEYQVIKPDGELSESGWLPCVQGESIKLTEDGSYIVYIRSSDSDGNANVIHSKIIVIDKSEPIIKDAQGNVVDNDKIIYIDEEFTITDTTLDKITVNGVVVDRLSLLGNKKATYTIVVRDKAGNKKTITVFANKILSLDELVAIQDVTNQNVKKGDIVKIKEALSALDELQATGAQQTFIEGLKGSYNGFLTYLDKLAQSLQALHTLANEEGWDAEKEQALRDAVSKLNEILQKDNLNAEDLQQAQTSLTYLKDKIALIEIDKGMKSLDKTTQDNVKTKQETMITEVLDIIKDAITQGNSQIKDDEAKNALQDKQDTLVSLKDMITNIINKITDVKDCMNNQNLSQAIEKSILDAVKAIIEELRSGEHLDEEETKYLQDANKVLETNEKIGDIQGYNPNDVTTNDRDTLHDIRDQIQDTLQDNSALTPDKVKEIETVFDTVQDLIDIVDDVFEKLENIKDVINGDLSKPVEKDRLEEAKKDVDDLKQSDNVLPEEKDYVENSDRVLDILSELEKLKDTTSKDVNVNQEKELKDILERIQAEKNNPALSQDKWNELSSNSTKIEEYIKKIEITKEATQRIEALKGYQDSNDLIVLEAYVKAIEDFMDSYGNNLDKEYLASLQQNLQTVKDKIRKLRSVSEVVWNKGEVTIEGMGGLTFDKDVVVQVEKVMNTLSSSFLEICKKNLESLKPGYVIDEIYEIELFLKNQNFTFDGRLQARIKLSREQLRLGNLGIIYIDDQGTVVEVNSRVENDYIIFETTHFSKYALIYMGSAADDVIKNTSSQTSQQASFMMFAFVALAFVEIKKRKKSSF